MTFKVLGAILTPYIRLNGVSKMTPLSFTRVQTDGSFRRTHPKSRVAAVITGPDANDRRSAVLEITARSSTETEWASVAFGLQFALSRDHDTIALENDNLSVIHGLIFRAPLKHEYARYYRNEIEQMSKQTLWTGVRWIPREINKADKLF